MDPLLPGIGFERKIAYSFLGLIVGDAVMLLVYSLVTQAWQQAPGQMPVHPLNVFPLYITCSLFAWVAVGLPAVLLANTDFAAGLKWYSTVLSGIVLALAALVILFIIYGHLPSLGLGGFFYCWGYAALVSCIACLIYVAMIRRALRMDREKDRLIDVPAPKEPEFRLEDYLRKPEDGADQR